MVVCFGGGHWIFDLSGPLGVDEVRTVVAEGEEVWQPDGSGHVTLGLGKRIREHVMTVAEKTNQP